MTAAGKTPCPTCSGPTRETVGMVCQTCGTDYAADHTPTADRDQEGEAEELQDVDWQQVERAAMRTASIYGVIGGLTSAIVGVILRAVLRGLS